jgi:hypothetical protein
MPIPQFSTKELAATFGAVLALRDGQFDALLQ